MIKAIVFDMNGVFIKDSGPLSNRIEEKYGISVDEIFPLIKSALKEVRQPGSGSKNSWQPILDKLNISYDELFKFWFSGESLNIELLDYVQELKNKGIKIMVLSNNFPERTNNYRKLYPELFNLIDEQYFSWETGNIKPDPKAYTQILDNNNFLPSEFLYFDDSEENIKVASSIGIESHLYQGIDQIKLLIK